MEMHYQNENNWIALIDLYTRKLKHVSSSASQEELLGQIASIYFFEKKDLKQAAHY